MEFESCDYKFNIEFTNFQENKKRGSEIDKPLTTTSMWFA